MSAEEKSGWKLTAFVMVALFAILCMLALWFSFVPSRLPQSSNPLLPTSLGLLIAFAFGGLILSIAALHEVNRSTPTDVGAEQPWFPHF